MNGKPLILATIAPQHAGLEAGAYLKEIKQVSNRQLQKIVRTKGIFLNGKRVHSKTRLRAGDRLQAFLPRAEQIKIPIASTWQFSVLYEDNWFLAVNKPAGLVSYALADKRGLSNQVAAYFLAQGQKLTPRPLHRLDKATSGVVLFAKSAVAQAKLSKYWQKGQINRYYWALCRGQLKTGLEIAVPLDGKRALTRLTPLRIFPDFSELMLELVTGRTHQLRRHLAGMGHPLLGDLRFAKASGRVQRLALHAAQIHFPHPFLQGKRVEVLAPTPVADFPFLESIAPLPL